MLKVLFIILLLSYSLFAQSNYAIRARCPVPNNLTSFGITLFANGTINHKTCASGYSLFNNPLVMRINPTQDEIDNYQFLPFGFGFDWLGRYNATSTGTNPFLNSEFYIDTVSPIATKQFKHTLFYTNYSFDGNPQNTSLLNGGIYQTILTGDSNIHDLQGFYSEARALDGRVGSSINAGVFSVDVRTPATAQDVSATALQTSIVNTTVRSAQALWIKPPVLTGATITDWQAAIRVDSAINTPSFMVSFDGTKINMTQSTPASSIETCRTGEIRIDANYIYACTSTNNFKRVSLSAF